MTPSSACSGVNSLGILKQGVAVASCGEPIVAVNGIAYFSKNDFRSFTFSQLPHGQ